MFKRVSLASLSAAERIVLRDARLRSGQCIRCFQTTRINAAEEAGGDSTPYNAPKRGPSRHQRAAMVAEKVQELQPGAKDASESPHPELMERSIDPEAAGQTSAPGRMGENITSTREGPIAQRGRRNEVFETGLVEDTNTSFEDATKADEDVQRSGEDNETSRGLAVRSGNDIATLNNDPASDGVPFQPVEHEKERDLLHMGENGSTIAAGNFVGVIEDRLRTLSEPAADTLRHPPYLAQKMMNGQLVRFVSQEEKEAVLQAALQIAKRRAYNISEQRGEDLKPINYEFSPLPPSVQQSTVDKMVGGKYDNDGILAGKSKYKHPVLNHIATMTMKNGTYLNSDGERLLKKVQSLLPAVQTSAQSQRASNPQKKETK